MLKHSLTLLVLLGIGCARPTAPPQQPCAELEPAASEQQSPQDVTVDGIRYDASGRAHLPSEPSEPLRGGVGGVAAVPAATDRFEVRTLGAVSERLPPRPRRVGKRDIALRQARLDNALRVIADAGQFNLVTQGPLNAPVTLKLRGVEPYDALLALAEAHDLQVQYRDGIVVARPAR